MLPHPCGKVQLILWMISLSFVPANCLGGTAGFGSPTFLCQKTEASIFGLRFEISAGSVETEAERRVTYRDHPSIRCNDNSTFFADRLVADLDRTSEGKFIEMSGNVSLVKEDISIRSQRAFTNDPCRYVEFRDNVVIRFKDGAEIRLERARYDFKRE